MKKLFLIGLCIILMMASLVNALSVVQNSGITTDAGGANVDRYGVVITVKSLGVNISSVTKDSACADTTKVFLCAFDDTDCSSAIASATFIGDVAVFSPQIVLNANTNYTLMADADTYGVSSKTYRYKASSLPVNNSYIIWASAQLYAGARPAQIMNFLSLNVTVDDLTTSFSNEITSISNNSVNMSSTVTSNNNLTVYGVQIYNSSIGWRNATYSSIITPKSVTYLKVDTGNVGLSGSNVANGDDLKNNGWTATSGKNLYNNTYAFNGTQGFYGDAGNTYSTGLVAYGANTSIIVWVYGKPVLTDNDFNIRIWNTGYSNFDDIGVVNGVLGVKPDGGAQVTGCGNIALNEWNQIKAYIVSASLAYACFRNISVNKTCCIGYDPAINVDIKDIRFEYTEKANLDEFAVIAGNESDPFPIIQTTILNYKSLTGISQYNLTYYTTFDSVTESWYRWWVTDIYGQTGYSSNLSLSGNSNPTSIFISQTPSDLNTLTMFSTNLTLLYNFTDDKAFNLSNVYVYYKTNTTLKNWWEIENGTIINEGFSKLGNAQLNDDGFVFNTSLNIWGFTLFDSILPSIYNIELNKVKNITHTAYTMTTNNEAFKIKFLNISNVNKYNILEIMANVSTGTASLPYYYCNSSYSSGIVESSSFCTLIYDQPYNLNYNHSHLKSYHWVVPYAINISTGKINNIVVTPTSYFVVRNPIGSNWNLWHTLNVTNSGQMQSSSNKGLSWSNQDTFTVDAHVHTFNGTETFYYYGCINDTNGAENCSSVNFDIFELGGLPPSVPVISIPTNSSYKGYINITYSASLSPNYYPILYYNITLLNLSESLISVIQGNNSNNLFYYWDASGIPTNNYKIRVTAYDNNSLSSFGLSSEFIIHNGYPQYNNLYTNGSLGTSKYGDTVLVQANLSDFAGISAYLVSHMGSHGWINSSFISATSNPILANMTYVQDDVRGVYTCNVVHFNNTLGTFNVTTPVCYWVANTPPISPTNINWLTSGGVSSTELSYYQTLSNIYSNCISDTVDNDTTYCNVSLIRPDGSYALQNKQMTNVSTAFSYSLSSALNQVGTWTINVTAWDIYNGTNSAINTFNVSKKSATVFDGFYAYDYGYIPDNNTINSDFDNYTYDTIGISMKWNNLSGDWNRVKILYNDSYNRNNQHGFFRFYFDGDYTPASAYTTTTCAEITLNLNTLRYEPYDVGIIAIIMDLNLSRGSKVNFTNTIAQCIVNATENKFPVYVNYTNSSLDSNWVSTFSLFNITSTSNQSFINIENSYLRNIISLTRIYYNLNAELKQFAKLYHDNIMTKLRADVIITNITIKNVAELSNGDLIAFNNQTTYTIYMINASNASRLNKDIWDSTTKTLIKTNFTGTFNINMSPLSFSNLFFDNIGHFFLTSVVNNPISFVNMQGWNKTALGDSAYSIVGANQLMTKLHDPEYTTKNTFMIHYEWINVSRTTNYSQYCDDGLIIIADKNKVQINNTINCTQKTYGYVSVADYANTDSWETGKKAECLDWINNYSTNIFLDGLDSGASGINFSIRFRRLIDYIQVEKNKSAITNDYTSYRTVGVGGIGDYDMKESFCGRWDGLVSNPTYSYETFSIDLDRAEFARSNNNPQLLMTFGDLFDFDKQAYCYAEYLVLFGTGNGNLYKYGQPNFQTQEDIFVLDAGDMIENTWTKVNDSYYYRKYNKGKVWFNPIDKTWDIEWGRQINNLTVNVASQIYCSAPPQTTGVKVYVSSSLNTEGNYTVVNWQDVVSNVSGGCCQWDAKVVKKDITSFYNKNGNYIIRLDSDVAGNPCGMNVYTNSNTYKTGVYSYYVATTYHPNNMDNTETTWTLYGRTATNLNTSQVSTTLEFTQSFSYQIDNGITDLTQNFTNYNGKYYNLTLATTNLKNYTVDVWSDVVTTRSFANITYNGTLLNVTNSTLCNTTTATFGTTVIDGLTHKACVNNNQLRVAVPVQKTSLTYTITDYDVAPTINIILPINNTYYNDSILININTTDDFGGETTYYKIDSGSWTLYSGAFGYSTEGNHLLSVNSTDNIGQSSYAYSNFTLDFTLPVITTTGSTLSGNYKQNYIYVNYSINETNLNRTTILLYNTSLVNTTIYTDLNNNANYTGLTDGYYYWNLTALDKATNKAYFATQTIKLDNTAPVIYNLTPSNLSYNTTTINLTFYAVDNLSTVYNYWYYNGSENVSYTSTQILTLSEGSYNYMLYANDTLNNINSKNIAFSINTYPVVSFGTGTMSGSYNKDYIFINATATDLTLRNVSIFLYNSSGSLLNYSVGVTPNTFNFTNLLSGIYYINASANDSTVYTSFTNTLEVTLDSSIPTIFNVTSSPSYYTSIIYVNASKSVNLSVKYGTTDNLGLNYSENIFANYSSITLSGLTETTLYYYNVTVCDLANNCNTTGIYNFTTTTAPVVVIGGGGGSSGSSCKTTNAMCFSNTECCSKSCVNLKCLSISASKNISNVTYPITIDGLNNFVNDTVNDIYQKFNITENPQIINNTTIENAKLSLVNLYNTILNNRIYLISFFIILGGFGVWGLLTLTKLWVRIVLGVFISLILTLTIYYLWWFK